jgi:hypothetical protein
MSSLGNLPAGLCIDFDVFDAVARPPVELVEADLLSLGGGAIKRYRTADEGKT